MLAGILWGLCLKLGFILPVLSGINPALFFTLLKPRKCVDEIPPHGLPDRSKEASDLLTDYFSRNVHLAQPRHSLMGSVVRIRALEKLVRSMPRSASDGQCGTVRSAKH